MEFPEKWELAQRQFNKFIKSYAFETSPHLPGYDDEDVEAEIFEVLWRCVLAYDPNCGATFRTYFYRACNNRLASLIRYASAAKRRAYVVDIDAESVRAEIERRRHTFSAEDEALLRINVLERRSVGGSRQHRPARQRAV